MLVQVLFEHSVMFYSACIGICNFKSNLFCIYNRIVGRETVIVTKSWYKGLEKSVVEGRVGNRVHTNQNKIKSTIVSFYDLRFQKPR